MGLMAPLVAANERRRTVGAAATVAAVRDALDKLDSAPRRLVEAGRLRLDHPDASLAELGALANPPMTKDAIAGVLRRLIRLAARQG